MMPAMAADGAEEAREGARVIAISDRVLLERHRRGDPSAFPALVAAFRAPVFGYLTRCGVPAADRDDLFQEVFLRVHRAAGPSSSGELPVGSVAPWLFTIAVNLVRSHFRKVTVRKGTTLDADAGLETPNAERPADRAMEQREQLAWVEEAMTRLPLEQREALVLSAIEGMELAEIAVALDAPVDTVKTRIRRARLALAEARTRMNVRSAREEAR
jgi:RNA polymerase sigma-70 factor (ECF subfamily)